MYIVNISFAAINQYSEYLIQCLLILSGIRSQEEKYVVSMNIGLKNRRVLFTLLLVITGIMIIITPGFIFPVCQAGGFSDSSLIKDVDQAENIKMVCSLSSTPMKCWYTARVETVLGALILLSGLALFIEKSVASLKVPGIIVTGLGLSVVLIPTNITGICDITSATCNIVTKPALILLGFVVVIIGLLMVGQVSNNNEVNRR